MTYALAPTGGAYRRAIRAGVARRWALDRQVEEALMPPPVPPDPLPSAIARRCVTVDLSDLPEGTDYAPGEGFVIQAVGAGTLVVRSEAAADEDPDVSLTLAAGETWTAGTLPQYARLVRNPGGTEGALTQFDAVFR